MQTKKIYTVILPNAVLNVFHKSSLIESIIWNDIVIERTLFSIHNTLINESTKAGLLDYNPIWEQFFQEYIDTRTIYTPEFFLDLFENHRNCIIRLSIDGRKDKYLFYLTEEKFQDTFQFLNIISTPYEQGIFGFIDDHSISGIAQSTLLEVCQNISLLGKISNVKVRDLDPSTSIDFVNNFERVDKYVYIKKDFIGISGNSGGGNLTSYITEEESNRRCDINHNQIFVSGTFRLRSLF